MVLIPSFFLSFFFSFLLPFFTPPPFFFFFWLACHFPVFFCLICFFLSFLRHFVCVSFYIDWYRSKFLFQSFFLFLPSLPLHFASILSSFLFSSFLISQRSCYLPFFFLSCPSLSQHLHPSPSTSAYIDTKTVVTSAQTRSGLVRRQNQIASDLFKRAVILSPHPFFVL